MTKKNLFATVLTYAAPSSNYRGESEENRTVLQKITRDGKEWVVLSPESIRNALREQLGALGDDSAPSNRRRLHDEEQLAVEFKEFPNAEKYIDDFLFGYLVADAKKAPKGRPLKRDSVLRMNMAVALSPYRFDATFHQSPLFKGAYQNATSSALLHREVSYTAFQFPFALAGSDCTSLVRVPNGKPEAFPQGAKWTRLLLSALGQLSDVAGGHARSLYEMAPRSVVARLTPSLVAGYKSYGFDEQGAFTELSRLREGDLPPAEFWLGGEVVRALPEERRKELAAAGAHLYDNPQALLEALGEAFVG